MNRWIVAAVVAVVLFAATGVLGSQRDVDHEARAVAAAWSAVGERLATTQTAGFIDEYGLHCFRYGIDKVRIDRRTLCFDPAGRLVSALHATRTSQSLSSLLPDGDRATIVLTAERISLGTRNASALGSIRRIVEDVQATFTACRYVIDALSRRVRIALAERSLPRKALSRAAHLAFFTCKGSVQQLQVSEKLASSWPSLQEAVMAITHRANELANIVKPYVPHLRGYVPPGFGRWSTYMDRESSADRRASATVALLDLEAETLIKDLVG
jgi:hypothetical protein